jgi:hypothetical protein
MLETNEYRSAHMDESMGINEHRYRSMLTNTTAEEKVSKKTDKDVS